MQTDYSPVWRRLLTQPIRACCCRLCRMSPPLTIEDTSWIKPGKVMRDTTLTTENSRAIIDFAATGGLQYTHLDWKWYGTEDPETGDATTVRAPNLDVNEIIRYGREK